jgi:EAL domain-containing protein (putative c-di-GMP-specific phosphodiesterase class I)
MHAQAVSLLRLESDLRQALDNDQFELYYQPIFDGKEDKVVKAEALIRWNHPRDGLIYPNQFIPLAEDTGLIIPIGEWVFQTACKQLKIWQDMGAHDFQVSVNFSARQFQQSNLAASVARTLEQTHIDPASLIIEITESRNFTQLDRFESILWELKRLGIQISIDDFGTGYSSLTTIQRLPLDILKIGQNFVSNLGAQRENDLIIMSIIEMAHRLGLTVVAEGVETPQQLSFLRTHQCDMIQGFLYSKPIRTPALEEMLKKTYK